MTFDFCVRFTKIVQSMLIMKVCRLRHNSTCLPCVSIAFTGLLALGLSAVHYHRDLSDAGTLMPMTHVPEIGTENLY